MLSVLVPCDDLVLSVVSEYTIVESNSEPGRVVRPRVTLLPSLRLGIYTRLMRVWPSESQNARLLNSKPESMMPSTTPLPV